MILSWVMIIELEILQSFVDGSVCHAICVLKSAFNSLLVFPTNFSRINSSKIQKWPS